MGRLGLSGFIIGFTRLYRVFEVPVVVPLRAPVRLVRGFRVVWGSGLVGL